MVTFVSFTRPSRQSPGEYIYYATTDSFQIPSSSIYINHATIDAETLSAALNHKFI
jgi:hypothetical protein